MGRVLENALKNSIPYKIICKDEQVLCRWLEVDEKNFTEPFFDETISHYLGNSGRYKCVSDLSMLPGWSDQVESIAPTAIIFHVSRCGSTLVSQLLSLSEENIVLSEVPFFDELLRGENEQLLKSAIRFYGAKRNEKQSRVFIKTDSWHILFYKQIRELYPNVPFILLYRKPGEVIRSQQRMRGMQAIPGMIDPGLFGFDRKEIERSSLDEYIVKVLEKYFQCFLEIVKKDPLSYLVNYNEGALNIIQKLANIVCMPVDDSYREEMKKRAGYHAKYPDQVFGEEKDRLEKPMDCTNVNRLYELLEKTRVLLQHQNELV